MSESISMLQLRDKLPTLGKNEVVLDVRGRDEFAEAHIKGALNIPHDEVGIHAAELKRYDKIYIHCRSGKRSQLATAELLKHGLTNLVCISDGGMMNWVEAGYETVKGN